MSYGIMSIDPGVSGTGIAVWSSDTWGKEKVNPVRVCNLMPVSGDDWQDTCRRFFYLITELHHKFNILKAYVEFPQYFQSEIGYAATTKGDIYKLSCIVGVFEGAMWAYGGKIEPVRVLDWKGQLPKSIVEDRIKKILPIIGELNPSTHSWDAIGIGLYKQGFFNAGK